MDFGDVVELSRALGPMAVFATVDDDGTPHVVPVVASWSEDRLVFGSQAASRKVHNLSTRTKAGMHYATPGEQFPDALLLKGAATVVHDDAERAAYWSGGLFPYLPMMYSGPEDPRLRFVEFTPSSAVVVRNGGRGPILRWKAPSLRTGATASPAAPSG